MKAILNTLFEHKHLTKSDAKEVLKNISKNQYNEAQVAAFITVYLMREISTEELSGFREALLEMAVPLTLECSDSAIDMCGTGGDGKNTFNISTLSSIVVAGAGYKVIKHGNYGVSSSCGSSNVLEALGYTFSSDEDTLNRQLDEANICFLHAPLFHPAMASVGPIRRSLKVKTFFNLLGPLVNPAHPRYQSGGVYSLQVGRQYHYLLQNTDKIYSVIHALDGYDEISLTGATKILNNDTEILLTPQDMGLATVSAASIHGGSTVPEAKNIFVSILEGNGSEAQRQVIYANAGMSIHTLDRNKSLSSCIAEAKESLDSGSALSTLKKLI